MNKKTAILGSVFSITIAAFIMLSSFINSQSLSNRFQETIAKDNAVVAQSVVNQLEYTLKYGKTLDNYYGIERVFEELRQYCSYADQIYIAAIDGEIRYRDTRNEAGSETPKQLTEYLAQVRESKTSAIWEEGKRQQILLPVRSGKEQEVIAALLVVYETDSLDSQISAYTNRIYINAAVASVIGVSLFLFLFFLIRKNQSRKSLLRIIIPSILISNLVFDGLSYGVFRSGYMEITHNTADIFGYKIANDIERVVSQGVCYEELYGIDRYFEEILGNTTQIESVSLDFEGDSGGVKQENSLIMNLPADVWGKRADLVMVPSRAYINERLRDVVLGLAVSVITSLMIAGEVVSFLLTLMTVNQKKHKKTVRKKEDRTYQPLGIVRGLSFFYAMFQYMAMAFVSIVLASIYKPVVIFGYELPYDIVMGLPLSIQILTSLFTAWLSGTLIRRNGWKPVAVAGILIMSAGTIVAAVAAEPYTFLAAQVIIGMGLGLSKTAFDIYSVFCASNKDMERYTSNSNAGTIVGMSCSSAIGAVIAGAFGYSGAYFVMGLMGGCVAVLVFILGLNIMEEPHKEKEAGKEKPGKEKVHKKGFDIRFFGYLIFMVLPYYFVMMFVDYFFPVYANGQGMSTEMIGYVFLAYGMCTSYLGVFACSYLTKRFSSSTQMTMLLTFTGIGILMFSIRNIFFFSVILVLIIAVSDGVMPSQQFKYVYSLPYSKRAGFTKAVSVEGVFSSGIRGVAPVIFGYVMMKGNRGLFVTAAIVIGCAAVFTLINRRRNS